MSVLDDLAAQLVAQGVGVLGSTIFISSAAIIPVGMGPYITLSETGGVAPTRVQNVSTPNTQRPTVQVLVRAGRIAGVQEAYPAARAKSWAVYQALDGLFNVLLGTTWYLKVAARQEPTDMGFDATGVRVQVVFNLDVEKSPS
jgi:hypothetical protein